MTFPDTTFTTGTTITSNWLNAVNDVCNNAQGFANIKSFGAVGDGSTDDTAAIQAALDSGQSLLVPEGTYIITTVTISNDILIQGLGPNSIFKRKNNYATNNTNTGLAANTMFDVIEIANVYFQNLTFDGNEQNQNVNHPSGALIRSWDILVASDEVLSVNVDSCQFINMTTSSITMKGNISSTGQCICNVTNSLFKDGRPGIGAGDPRSPNASGFAPTYINANDRARLNVSNNKFIFTETLSTVSPIDYAPTAVRFTYVDATTDANGSIGTVDGNYFYRCGRGIRTWDASGYENNALGIIEAYTIGQNIIVSNNTFETNLEVPVRAKSSLNRCVISGNIIKQVDKTAGISVGPTSDSYYGTQAGEIIISNNVVEDTDIFGISVVGNSDVTPDYVSDILISNNIVKTVLNTLNETGGNQGAITVRSGRHVVISGNIVDNIDADSNLDAIKVRECYDAVISNNHITNIGRYGIYGYNIYEKFTMGNNIIRNCGGVGIQVSSSSTLPDTSITGNVINTTVNYGVFVQHCGNASIVGNIALDISGSSRGFYVPSTATLATLQGNITDASTQFSWTNSGNVTHSGNSWNAIVSQRTAYPTSGTWKVGDIVWNSSPASGEYMGWTCTVAGTPGTWNGFGTIA